MLELTIQEAYDRAGVYDSDNDMERDLKLAAWINCETWCCVCSQEELEQARKDGIEIIIKKRNRIMSANHDAIKAAFETYIAENTKFSEKGVKAAAARARKALQEMSKAIKERRKEITAEKEALSEKK